MQTVKVHYRSFFKLGAQICRKKYVNFGEDKYVF